MRSVSSPRAVSMMIGMSERARTSRHSVSPSVPGSITSSTRMSGARFVERRPHGFAVAHRGYAVAVFAR